MAFTSISVGSSFACLRKSQPAPSNAHRRFTGESFAAAHSAGKLRLPQHARASRGFGMHSRNPEEKSAMKRVEEQGLMKRTDAGVLWPALTAAACSGIILTPGQPEIAIMIHSPHLNDPNLLCRLGCCHNFLSSGRCP